MRCWPHPANPSQPRPWTSGGAGPSRAAEGTRCWLHLPHGALYKCARSHRVGSGALLQPPEARPGPPSGSNEGTQPCWPHPRWDPPLGQPDASPLSCPVSLQACMATMYRCVHFWGFKALEDASRRSDPSGADEMTDFQMTLCSVLVRRPRGGAAEA